MEWDFFGRKESNDMEASRKQERHLLYLFTETEKKIIYLKELKKK